MLTRIIVRTIDISARYAWFVLGIGLLLAAASGAYAVRHFAINTDISKLISPDLTWRKREMAFHAAFPHRAETIVAVIDAPTPELAKEASNALTQKLSEQKTLFRAVTQPGGGAFFVRNGFLFLSPEELTGATRQLMTAQPLIGGLVSDPSLRGLTRTLSIALGGLRGGQYKLEDLTRPLNLVSDTLDDVAADRPASFSWQVLLSGKPAETNQLRQVVSVWAVLDYSELEPGGKPTAAIRKAAADLNLEKDFQARVRLTGPVRIADEEFATVQEGALLNTTLTVLTVLLILWLALRSARIIGAVFVCLLVGLAMTAAAGLMMVGAFNMISVSFAVLFVGLGVDFAIQYSVRYRAERHEYPDLREALLQAGDHAGAPLTLAATAVACGFLSFMPTAYRGLSELGLIAGVGMLIAFATSVTLLPALLSILKPPGEPEPMGYKIMAPVDAFMERYRIPIIAITGIVVTAGLPLLYWLHFDFNPINLRSTKVESISTYLDLQKDPMSDASAIEVVTPSVAASVTAAERLSKVPEVSRTMTVQSFVPDRQPEKLPLIRNAQRALEQPLRARVGTPPTDAENVAALKSAADALTQAAGNNDDNTGAVAAKRLAAALMKLANADVSMRAKAQAVFIYPLQIALNDLREKLQAQTVTIESLPTDLTRDWIVPDGRARAQATPKGDQADNENLRRFARAVLAVEPNAIDGPISILESGDAIVWAFLQAGFWALFSIAILLYLSLRRISDVLLTLIPLLLAGVVTLEICVLIGMPLNFANIIALPLLLGVGVAFKIYYIMAWRAGQTNLLQSSLTRAVFFSALTTVTAFGSLWFSSHPGTSSMGKLLALSLLTTMAAAVLFQPVLMGKPREEALADADGGKPDDSKPEEPKSGESKGDEAKSAAPQADAPKANDLKVEEPKAADLANSEPAKPDATKAEGTAKKAKKKPKAEFAKSE
jgi:hopanoid biosynthesis associated RND transporter like protein HpnN